MAENTQAPKDKTSDKEAVQAKKNQKVIHAEEIERVQSKKKARSVKVQVVSKKKTVTPSGDCRDIGVDVAAPAGTCKDRDCPFHGHLKVRGQLLTGIVVSSRMDKTVVVQKTKLYYVDKFERYEKRSRNILAHNPGCVAAKEGDQVRIMECRPLSKNKSYVVIEREAMQ